MSSDPLAGPILLILALLLAYGWLSGAQAALRALNEARLRHDAEEDDPQAKLLLPLAEEPDESRTALRICATVVGILTAAVAGVWVAPALKEALLSAGIGFGGGWLTALCVLIVSLLLGFVMLCFFGTLPRRMAEMTPEATTCRRLKAIRVLTTVFRPLVRLLYAISGLLLKLLRVRPEESAEEVTEEDIRGMVDMGSESGAIEENEKELIENIFNFNNRSAEDVMTHRTDVTAIWIGDSREAIVQTILDTGLSRFPVYDKDMDDIIGILNTRDFLLNSHLEHPKSLRELLREAYFVPETVQADVLFRDMQKRKVHMAVVVDEYGGVSGIVTMEDLLEEIVGDIYDEFDPAEGADIVPVEDGQWRIRGTAPLEDVAKALDVDLPTGEDYDTLGGLIFSRLTTIPEDGSRPVIDACGLHIQVEKMEDHRVETALVSKLAPPEPPAEA